ncbi:MAG: hypothetical protein ACOYXN_09930 [Acidobacteriota bacterium]
MPELDLGGILQGPAPHLAPDLFDRMGPTLEGLRQTVLALTRHEEHPFRHTPGDAALEASVRHQARLLRREAEVLVVAGIGGSSLGARVLCAGPRSRVRFLEGLDPSSLSARLQAVPWDRASLCVVSKSGGTLETLVNAALALEALRKACPQRWRQRTVLVASPGSGPLHRWAEAEGIPRLDIPSPVGGRYSVLTPVGLLPAAFDGVDPSAVLSGARLGADKALLLTGSRNPALALALLLVQFYAQGLKEVDLWGYGERPYLFARWIQQLWGESLGRKVGGEDGHRIGPTPLACLGSEDQHSLLQLFSDGPRTRWLLVFSEDSPGPPLSAEARAFAGLPPAAANVGAVQRALCEGTARALCEAGVPVARYGLGGADAASLGEAFFVFMAATVYAAALFEVDPFGQPGVEAGKRRTREILGAV